ncbi:MAG: hypothetical protein QXT22_02970 [Candidatus Hadarchaeales archaeon]
MAENIVVNGTLSADNAGYMYPDYPGPGGGGGGGYGTGGLGGAAYDNIDNVCMGSGGGWSKYSYVGPHAGGGGGGYGGAGGNGGHMGDSGTTGPFTNYGGRGGGRIVLEAKNFFSYSGTITANGGAGTDAPAADQGGGGGGSGGGILIRAERVSFNILSAKGGRGGNGGADGGGGGGGGGGRIKIYHFYGQLEEGIYYVNGGSGGIGGVDAGNGVPGQNGTYQTFVIRRWERIEKVQEIYIFALASWKSVEDWAATILTYSPEFTSVENWNAIITTEPCEWSQVEKWGANVISQVQSPGGEGGGGASGWIAPPPDIIPPLLELLDPKTHEVEENLIIRVRMSDASGIDYSSIVVKIDNKIERYSVDGNLLIIVLTNMASGDHLIQVKVKDASLMKNENSIIFWIHVVKIQEPSHENLEMVAENLGILKVFVKTNDGTLLENAVKIEKADLSTIPLPENVMCYSSFELQKLDNSLPAVGKVLFSVPREWLREKGLGPFAVHLFKIIENRMEEMETDIDGGDLSHISYSATVVDFSKFVIGGKITFPKILIPSRVTVSNGSLKIPIMIENPVPKAFSRHIQIKIGGHVTIFDAGTGPLSEKTVEVVIPVSEMSGGLQEVEMWDALTQSFLEKREVEIEVVSSGSPSSGDQFPLLLIGGGMAAGFCSAAFWKLNRRREARERRQVKLVGRAQAWSIESSPIVKDYCDLLLPLSRKRRRREL